VVVSPEAETTGVVVVVEVESVGATRVLVFEAEVVSMVVSMVV